MIEVKKIKNYTDIVANLKKIRSDIQSVVQQNATEINTLDSNDPRLAISVTTYFNTLAIIDSAVATSIDAIEKGFVKSK